MSLMLDNLSNRFVHPSQYGRMEATFEVFAACGSIVGPIVGGIFMDNYGMTIMVLAIGVLALATSIFYHHKAKYLQHA